MPWDNSVNKTMSIYAYRSSSLVEQFPIYETVEWADLVIDRYEIISQNWNLIHYCIKRNVAPIFIHNNPNKFCMIKIIIFIRLTIQYIYQVIVI